MINCMRTGSNPSRLVSLDKGIQRLIDVVLFYYELHVGIILLYKISNDTMKASLFS